MKSINILINSLIDRKLNKQLIKICYGDDLYISRNYYKDKVEESKIILLLKQSHRKWKLQVVLLDIFYYIEESCFTDKIIDICKNYPGKFKKTLLIQLAHIWLSEKQLENIIEVIKVPEAYCKLLIIKVCNEECPEYELEKFVQMNSQYFKDLKSIDRYFIDTNISADRIKVVENLLSSIQ